MKSKQRPPSPLLAKPMGHYDAHGWWQGDGVPPGGQWYSVLHDKRTVPLETQNAPDDISMDIEQDEFDV